jgi:hypothetical protein
MELFGPAEGLHLTGLAARLIGMHYHDRALEILAPPGVVDSTPSGAVAPGAADGAAAEANDFVYVLARVLAGQGDEVVVERRDDGGDSGVVRQRGFRLMRGVEHPAPEVFAAWVELWRGFTAAHDRRLRIDAERTAEGGCILRVTKIARSA